MAKTAEQLKQLSIEEFTEAARIYESGHAGIYEICKDDYPQMLEELRSDSFEDVLDVGCGTGAVLELLHGEYPEKHLTGLDLTPGMIDVARAKQLENVCFVVGDAEALPFESQSFGAVLCSNSFHHYPHPEKFFSEAARVLRPGGRLILRDYTSNDFVVWLMNNIELPLARPPHGPRRRPDFQGIRTSCARRGSRAHRSQTRSPKGLPRASGGEERVANQIRTRRHKRGGAFFYKVSTACCKSRLTRLRNRGR